MELIKGILKGQKKFILDIFALFNVIILTFAYFVGVGLSRLLFKEEKEKSRETYWKDSELTNNSIESNLRQF